MLIILIPLSGILALIYNLWKSNRISRQDFGTEKIAAISGQIAGGARENAEKMFEEDIEIEGQTYYKGSNPQKIEVFGDSVGDPFKEIPVFVKYSNKINDNSFTCNCAFN